MARHIFFSRLFRTISRNWLVATLVLNIENAMSNRRVFWSMMLFMALQNLVYFMLWVAVFSQIGSLRGWGLREVAFISAVGAPGLGLMNFLAGGLDILSETIQTNRLDSCLARPRPVLLGALFLRCRPDSLGDVLFGLMMMALFVQPTLSEIPLALTLMLSIGFVFTAVRLFLHSLAFWGMSETAAEGSFMAVLIAGTNPLKGFGLWGKVLLLTVFPAGYMALLPVEIFLDFRWDWLLWQIGASLGLLGLAVFVFYRGLRRYESGNGYVGVS